METLSYTLAPLGLLPCDFVVTAGIQSGWHDHKVKKSSSAGAELSRYVCCCCTQSI